MTITETTTTFDPAHLALEGFDPTAPIFEVWVGARNPDAPMRRFACTQVPAKAFRLLRDMHAGRPNLAPPELRVINDRRRTER